MKHVDLLYASKDGHTRKICETLAQILQKRSFSTQLWDLHQDTPPVENLHHVLIAAPVRYGFHDSKVVRYINQNSTALQGKQGALLSVNLVARKAEKQSPKANPYTAKLLQKIAWKPQEIAVIAGKLDYPKYRIWDRLLIQWIMKMTQGPTDPQTVRDYTDWEALQQFGMQVFDKKIPLDLE